MTKKIILILSGIIVVALLLLVIYFFWSVNSHGKGEEKEIIIKSGQSTRQIAKNLEEKGVITSETVFTFYTKLKGEMIQVGVYKLSRAESMKEILGILASGKASEYLVTIPEGWRLTQIDELLAEKGVITAGELEKIASSDEGYLFPDTYRFLPKTPATEVRQMMLDNFKKKTVGLNLTRDNVILASIVEREAKFDEDRARIAGVYLNRLEKGMKLEADPTVQYAKGSWEPIKVPDYHNATSPYNTYLNLGLPPGPICNPGLKSLEAVLQPEKNGYLYFFHKSDGRAVFSSTFEEHEANLKKYQ